jgi:hypothetical protein
MGAYVRNLYGVLLFSFHRDNHPVFASGSGDHKWVGRDRDQTRRRDFHRLSSQRKPMWPEWFETCLAEAGMVFLLCAIGGGALLPGKASPPPATAVSARIRRASPQRIQRPHASHHGRRSQRGSASQPSFALDRVHDDSFVSYIVGPACTGRWCDYVSPSDRVPLAPRQLGISALSALVILPRPTATIQFARDPVGVQ